MQKISISGPAELLAVLPFHLGFRPTRSAVLVCLHERRLGLVARLDLCPREEAVETASQVLPALRAEGPGRVMLVGYEDLPGESAALCDALVEALAREGIELADHLVVRGGRWYGVSCECCPDEGTPLLDDADVPGVAGFVALGKAVLPDRASVAALMAPREDAPASLGDSIREFADELECARSLPASPPGPSSSTGGVGALDQAGLVPLLERAAAAWRRFLSAGRGEAPPAQDVPALVGCLRDVQVRDALITWFCPGSLHRDDLEPVVVEVFEKELGPFASAPDPQRRLVLGRQRQASDRHWSWDREEVQSRLQALCRAVPAEDVTPLLSVVASYAWWCGDGTRAGVALERALDLEPDHRLCALLRRMIALGIRTDRVSA